MPLLTLAVCAVALLVLEVPVAFSIGLAAVVTAVLTRITPGQVLVIQMVSTATSFVLLAIPMFIFAGTLMAEGGIAADLVVLAEFLVRRIRGGLGLSVVVASMFFSGITGAKVAEVAAISSTMVPGLLQHGYPAAYSTAIIASASAAGELIPPAITMIVLGQIMNLSITKLFLGGILPAIVLGGLTMCVIGCQARRRVRDVRPVEATRLKRAIGGGLLAAGMPAIIFGGILGGVFSPTEAAAVSALYALVVALGIYRRLSVAQVFRIACDAGVMGGALMLLIMTASAFSNVLTVERVPSALVGWASHISNARWFVLIVTTVIFLLLGSALEGLPALIIFVPVLTPLALSSGIDPIHFGIVIIASVGVGLFLPPFGIGFLTACSVGRVTISAVTRLYMPFVVALTFGLIVLVFIPWLSTTLPALLGP